MDRVHEIVGSRKVHQRGILGRHVGIAILDTGGGVKELLYRGLGIGIILAVCPVFTRALSLFLTK